MSNLKNKILIVFSFIILVFLNFQFYNSFLSGWLGPNASIKAYDFSEIQAHYNAILKPKDIILFDDNTYHFLKSYSNKKMPITYFKLYLDKIPDISYNNLGQNKALSLTNCAFIDEFKQFNNGKIVINELFRTNINGFNFCIYDFNPLIN